MGKAEFFVVEGALTSPSGESEFFVVEGALLTSPSGESEFFVVEGALSRVPACVGRGESECFSTLRAGSHCSAPCNMKDECSAPCNMNVIAALSFDEMATHTSPVVGPVVSSRTGPAPIRHEVRRRIITSFN